MPYSSIRCHLSTPVLPRISYPIISNAWQIMNQQDGDDLNRVKTGVACRYGARRRKQSWRAGEIGRWPDSEATSQLVDSGLATLMYEGFG